jgi:hypothetical protein
MVSDKITPIEGRQIEKELTEEIKRMLTAFVVAGSKPEVPKKKERKAENGQT